MTSKVKCAICILYGSVARGVLALLCSWVWGLVRPFIGVLFLCLGCNFAAVLMLRVCVFVSWPCTLLFKDPSGFSRTPLPETHCGKRGGFRLDF